MRSKYLREAIGFIYQLNEANSTSLDGKALAEQEILQRLEEVSNLRFQRQVA